MSCIHGKAVNVATHQESALLQITLGRLGYRWPGGDNLPYRKPIETHSDKAIIFVNKALKQMTFCNIKYAKSKDDRIYSMNEFFGEELQEVI